MEDLKKVRLNIGKLSAATSIGSDSNSTTQTEHFHTVVQPYIRLGADEYLYIEERCIECGKILNERRIKTEPLLEAKNDKGEDRKHPGTDV